MQAQRREKTSWTNASLTCLAAQGRFQPCCEINSALRCRWEVAPLPSCQFSRCLPFARADENNRPMNTKHFALICSLVIGGAAVSALAAEAQKLGYKDTPMLPGTEWHVHDGDRPQPRIVTPGKTFSHLAPAP